MTSARLNRSSLTVLLVAVVAASAASATLAIPQRIDSQAKSARYGKPLWFAESDMSSHDLARGRKERWRFDPLENPTTFSPIRFVGATAIVGGGVGAVLLAARLLLRRRHRAG